MSSDVIRANVEVHSRMVEVYAKEPHFRPENQAKVRGVLADLRTRAKGGKLLDLGCGTGFIINLARDLFDEIHGLDVTPAMLAKVDTSRGNITLHNTNAERLPFGDGAFDVVTGYSFLHHLEDFRPVLREAFRVLKPGGLGYFDLDPNRLFWKALMDLEGSHAAGLSDIVQREIHAILHLDEQVEAEYGIKKELFQKAEPMKAFQGGLHPAEFKAAAEECGFSECDVRFEWFLGQGAVMHGQSFEASATVEAYLRRALPLTGHLFKYLQFLVRK